MRISLAELNNIVNELENSGHYKEAQDLHLVFVKVANLEKEAGLKEFGKAAIPALALMGNMGNVNDNVKPIEDASSNQQQMIQPMKLQQPSSEEDPIEKDLEVINREEQQFSGNVSDRLKEFLEKFEWSEISKILTKKGINRKIESEADLDDPEILDALEDYYKDMNLEKLNPVFDPIGQEISRLIMNNKSNEQRLVKLIKQYWGLQNRSSRFDSVFMRELNLKLKQVANTDRTQLRKFLLMLRMNFQTKPVPKKSMFPDA